MECVIVQSMGRRTQLTRNGIKSGWFASVVASDSWVAKSLTTTELRSAEAVLVRSTSIIIDITQY